MEENYVEWLVKRKDPVYAWPVKSIDDRIVCIICICSPSGHVRSIDPWQQVLRRILFFKPQCRI